MRTMRSSLDDFVASTIHEAKRSTQYWHKDNPYQAKISDNCAIMDVRNYVRQGEAWEEGFLAATYGKS